MVRMLLQLNVLLAFAAASITASCPLLIGVTPGWTGPAIAFALTLAIYNFDRIADASPDEGRSTPLRAATVRRVRRILVWLIPALLLASVTTAALAGIKPLLWSLAFPLLGIAYILPILPTRTGRPKDVPYLKCFYTAGCWATFTGLGMSTSGLAVVPNALPIALFVFVRMFASTYLGDLRDVEDDAAAGLKTIAGTIGTRASHRLLDAIHVMSVLLLLTYVGWRLMPPAALVLLVPMATGFGIYRLYRRFPHRHEILFELYDIDFALFAPSLLIAGALS